MKYISLNTGAKMPVIGLGTFKSGAGEVYQAIRWALKLGYNHFDCASIYGNQEEIGQAFHDAFKEDNLKREQIFITSKLWNDSHNPQDVLPALEQTLKELQLEYLDLWLMHWPVAQKKGSAVPQNEDDLISLSELPLSVTYKQMENAQKQGLTKAIGVSNFGQKNLENIISECEIVPAVNQIESHPYLVQTELIDFCKKNMITVTAYSPLGAGEHIGQENLLEDKTIVEIAQKLNITPAQVLLSWQINRDVVVIPKSVHEARLKENLTALNVALDSEDMQKISSLNKNHRYIDAKVFAYKDYTQDSIFA
ncbi:MAG: aldo/keto reductase [Alphaproteobacteria bacterium]|nr:aldo/keto reductase [Alphaproteobacteria bacterium]